MANQKPIKVEMNHNLKVKHLGSNTKATYMDRADKFAEYLTARGMKRATKGEAIEQIQNYMEHLAANHYSAATQKTSLAAICKALDVKMEDYDYAKPEISTKGRENTGIRNELNERVIEFAEKVGIRETEYAKLTGKDFVERDGLSYVIVQKGKGGKYQEQLISEKDKDFIKSYFDGTDNRIFTKGEMRACRHANLHSVRREHAQKMYEDYKKMPQSERDEIIDLIEQRMDANPKKFGKLDRAKLDRPYVVRGIYRKEYLRLGKDTSLDRFALKAVSVLHLSHYREDVVVHHYMI